MTNSGSGQARKNLPGVDVSSAQAQTSADDASLSASVPASIKDLIASFVCMFYVSGSKDGQCSWTEDMKTSLTKCVCF